MRRCLHTSDQSVNKLYSQEKRETAQLYQATARRDDGLAGHPRRQTVPGQSRAALDERSHRFEQKASPPLVHQREKSKSPTSTFAATTVSPDKARRLEGALKDLRLK